jgi:4-methyl-5(b-hydroxyethyl)-thiazole monophosphate biosynthesis
MSRILGWILDGHNVKLIPHWREFMKKKKILLVVYPTFSEFEITVSTAILKAHFDIITASDSLSPVIGESSLRILPHITFGEVVEEYEGIIIPGGDLYYIKDSDALFRLVETRQTSGCYL